MERYRSLTESYFRYCKAVLFVYSADNRDSFLKLTEWDSYVQAYDTNRSIRK